MKQFTRRAFPWPMLVGIVLIGFILRGPIIAVAPITGILRADLGLTAAEVGLLTSLPVLCFALVTPLASFFVGRGGANFSTTVAIIGVGIGSIVRSSGGVEAAFVGTVIMGGFITIGNVVVPVLIRRDVPPQRVGIVTGAYTSALNVSSMITSLATAPLAEAFGWHVALLAWLGFVVIAAGGWMFAVGPRAAFRFGPVAPLIETGAVDTVVIDTGRIDLRPTSAAEEARRPRTWRSASALLLALAFSGQAFAYYGLTAWFPSILVQELGFTVTAAGSSSSVFQIAAVVGALGVPLLSQRIGVPRTFALVAALWLSCPIGLLLAPSSWLAWGFFGGVAQGGGITIVFMLIVQLAVSGTHARGLSAMIQGTGYALGATAPTLIGAVHDATGAWGAPLAVVGIGTLAFTAAGLAGSLRATRGTRQSVIER
ncbi:MULTISPECIES: CynX/NimT family MFS transporter [Subtercola]|uniref:MFS transporter n=1 Tax=Subtercola vilae TaxID=2056433 RepID=A0A4T2C6S6_9MICO|nr:MULTISPECIES: MFS transporter [Subtercola]MEA9985455.1 MFS transporter [Subtercola sp. RTI3]TIH39322.1 MFS transporter [Subtercola vilae]